MVKRYLIFLFVLAISAGGTLKAQELEPLQADRPDQTESAFLVPRGYNLGTEWSGNSNEPTYIYSLASGISLTPQLGGFIEVYGYLPVEEDADHRFDCGVTYLVSNDLMVDLSGGVGITQNAPDSFISLGFSWRFDVRKE